MDGQSNQKHLLKILTEAVKNRIYGSVEIYFEDGRMTQITQRIINKIHANKQPRKILKQQHTAVVRERIPQQEVEISSIEL